MQFRVLALRSASVPSPWTEKGQPSDLYRTMGMLEQKESYIAVWLLLANAAIVTVHQVVNLDHFNLLFREGRDVCLSKRLKLVINPIVASLPAVATDPDKAGFADSLLGKNGSGMYWSTAECGAQFLCIMADFNAKMLLRWTVVPMGFREGNMLDLHIVDWKEKALLASGRVIVTKEFLKRMGC